MPLGLTNVPSLRVDRLETSRLAWAFALSLAVHLLAWGTYTEGRKLHVWDHVHLPAWIKVMTQPLVRVAKKPPPELVNQEPQLMFVDVGPQQAVTEPPKNAKFYSNKNSQAANPDANKETDTPKIAGTQNQVAKTEDVPRNQFDKLQPTPPAPVAKQDNPAEQAAPKPVVSPGDLTLAKPEPKPRQDNGTADQPRPRTIREAPELQPANRLAGLKMKQEGGVKRHLEFSSLDAKATPFGSYDAAFIEAVQQYWFDELDSIHYDGAQQGRVTVQFHLNSTGLISEMKVMDNTVGETLGLLCQRAVLAPAPYAKWPTELRLLVGRDFREIQFTFYYN